ncbi:hypothetical protein [Brachybacterium alimentarium]|uniref:hypothetical protein n=1 Tax=Brachybacterium alimentarium TaxID=47845 RepID=UPI000DF41C66|nr:hypothetical protein [Brachybacterium alimentarium]RCS81829.1 hypothetical protein CIK67_15645 [Brachybacterium alimentarium]
MMPDLFTTAMAWIQDQGLPEPDSMKLLHGGRVELDYHRDYHELPSLDFRASKAGTHAFAEQYAGEIFVSVYAQRTAVPA